MINAKTVWITIITIAVTSIIIYFKQSLLNILNDIPERPIVKEHQELISLIDSSLSDEETAQIILDTDYTVAELNGFMGGVKSEIPIHHAITINKVQTLTTLLELGADPNVSNDFYYTGLKFDSNARVYFYNVSPVAYAVYCGNRKALEILIEHGADLNSSFSRLVYGTDGILNNTAASYAESIGKKTMANIIKEAGGIVPEFFYTRNKNHILIN